MLLLVLGWPTQSCTHAEPIEDAGEWYEIVSHDPDAGVTDLTMRRRIDASGHPWKVRDRGTGIEMVLVLPGEFLMGAPESDADRARDEAPQHRVRLTRPFYLGATEVTQAQWQRLMGPRRVFFEGEHNPIDPSLDDVQAFLAKANRLSRAHERLRLPTEAEWEYACRAGTTGPFHFEGPIGHGLVNFNDGDVEHAVVVDGKLEVEWATPPSAECRMATAPAGSLPANAWGLHEMHGNLWEWTADRYSPDGYAGRGAVTVDPFEQPSSEDAHTLRGGSWYDSVDECRSSARDRATPHTRSNRIGLRVARTL